MIVEGLFRGYHFIPFVHSFHMHWQGPSLRISLSRMFNCIALRHPIISVHCNVQNSRKPPEKTIQAHQAHHTPKYILPPSQTPRSLDWRRPRHHLYIA